MISTDTNGYPREEKMCKSTLDKSILERRDNDISLVLLELVLLEKVSAQKGSPYLS
jgi:LGFP repeat